MKRLAIAPSILAADFGRLAEEVRVVDAAGADWIHIDVMDGRFVPNISFGPVVVEYVLHLCDVILVMTVNPGFGGQKFLPEMLPKIRELRRMCESKKLDTWIEVDGGQNGENAGQVVEAGADAIVAGSAVFHSHDYAAAISNLRKVAMRKAEPQ